MTIESAIEQLNKLKHRGATHVYGWDDESIIAVSIEGPTTDDQRNVGAADEDGGFTWELEPANPSHFNPRRKRVAVPLA